MTYTTRTIRIIGRQQIDTAINAIRSLPTGEDLEVIIRKAQKARKLDQNALYHAGPLRDIAEQAWIGGRQYSAAVLHEYLKSQYLPEDDAPELDSLTKEGYQKWAFDPSDTKILVGSTTQLTIKGFSRYLEQVHAFGASLGVEFSAKEAA